MVNKDMYETDEDKRMLARGIKRTPKSTLYVYEKHDTVMERVLFEKGVNSGWLKERGVYNNVFHTVDNFIIILNGMDYEVAYGYIKITDKLYLRSCFLVREDKVVDTNVCFYEEVGESKYIVFHKMHAIDYLKTVLKSGGDLTLRDTLKEKERVWFDYAKRKGIKSIGG